MLHCAKNHKIAYPGCQAISATFLNEGILQPASICFI